MFKIPIFEILRKREVTDDFLQFFAVLEWGIAFWLL